MRGAESTSLSQQTPESRHITSAICFDSLLASACGGHSPNLTHGPVLPCTLFKLKFDSSLKKKKRCPCPSHMASQETGKWNLSGTACSQLSPEVGGRGSQGVMHISMGCAPNTRPIVGGPALGLQRPGTKDSPPGQVDACEVGIVLPHASC